MNDFELEVERLEELKVRLKNKLITYKQYLDFFKVMFLCDFERRKFKKLN